jgi:hypothetical protein
MTVQLAKESLMAARPEEGTAFSFAIISWDCRDRRILNRDSINA